MNLVKIVLLGLFFSIVASATETPVSYYGTLSVSDNQIISVQTDKPVQLRGVSLSSANQSENSFFNPKTVSSMVDVWKAEVIRLPLEYTTFKEDTSSYMALFETMVQACITKGVYVVLTWRSDSLNFSLEEKEFAIQFFTRMAQTFSSFPNVIFEIFEHPKASNWNQIKEVQNSIINEIRLYSNGLIIVGTPSLSQDVEFVVENPIFSTNIVYSFQFNAGTETPTSFGPNLIQFKDKIRMFLDAQYPIFVSNFTTTHSDGGLNDMGHYNTHDSLSANQWLSFLDSIGISYIAASVSDDYIGSAFFGIDTSHFDQSVVANWSNPSLMTTSGSYIYNKWINYALTAPWNTESPSSSSSIAEESSSSEMSSSSIESSSSSVPLMSLIDDFTDGNSRANTKEYWYIYTDVNDDGKSTVGNEGSGTSYELVFDDGTGNNAASIQNFLLVQGGNENDPYVALGLNTEKNGSSYFLSGCTEGFSYRYKGVAHRFRVDMTTVTNFDNHYKEMPACSVWTSVSVLPSDLKQDEWGETVVFNLAKIKAFVWEVKKTPTSGSLWVDDFYCLGADLGLSSSSSIASSSSISSSSSLSSSSQILSSSSQVLSSSSSIESSSSFVPLMSLIDDFTDGNSRANTKEYWYIYTDVNDDGESTVGNEVSGTSYELVFDDGTGNNAASIQNFLLVQGGNANDPYVALGLNAKNNGTSYLLSGCTEGFSYRYKGVDHRFKVEITTVTDYNYHYKSIPASSVWTTVSVLPSDLKQDKWGETVAFNLAKIKAFVWEVKKTPTSGSLWVDDFYCLGADLGIQSSSSSAIVASSSSTVSIPSSDLLVKWNILENGRLVSFILEENENVWVDVFDLQGNSILSSKNVTSQNNMISLKSLSSGRYLIRIRSHKQQMIKSLRLY